MHHLLDITINYMYIPIANREKTFSQSQKMQRMFETKNIS